MFVIDATGSMGSDIYGVRENVSAFAKQLYDNGLDVRFSVVEYRDVTDAGARLRLNQVHTVVVSYPDYYEHYRPLWEAYTGGMFIEMSGDYYKM